MKIHIGFRQGIKLVSLRGAAVALTLALTPRGLKGLSVPDYLPTGHRRKRDDRWVLKRDFHQRGDEGNEMFQWLYLSIAQL